RAEAEHDVDARVDLLEPGLELAERLRERRGGEDRERPRLGLPRGGTTAARAGAGREQQRCHRRGRPPHELAPGVSTTTVVDLITATASAPGSRPISLTASLDISETIRCGPHCISTCAITRSATTDVTRPTSRLRAELRTSDGSGGAAAWSRANAASAAPSITLRFDASTCTGSAPASTQRRTVSSLTPSSRAASAILNCGTNPTIGPRMRLQPGRVVCGWVLVVDFEPSTVAA